MKILVLSDSHSGLSFMRRAIATVKPDRIIHLGDYYDDALAIGEEFPQIPMYQLPGNCDRFRCPPDVAPIRIERVDGVNLYMTHGHIHRVKQTLGLLLNDARQSHADAVLYGHTHIPDCRRDDSGMWILNPGSCGSFGGTVGLIEIENHTIVNCCLLWQENLEELL